MISWLATAARPWRDAAESDHDEPARFAVENALAELNAQQSRISGAWRPLPRRFGARYYVSCESAEFHMVADSDSNIAWHRVQLKKNRAELKALETARFTMGEIASSKRNGQTQKTIAGLKRKIAQSERSIADYERRTRRPLATDLQSLSNGSWSHWDANTAQRQRKTGQRSPRGG
jgi:hypothetical protein